ncbi:excalibur calcium-binding domain-containing protein [Nocardia sp. NPDC087230]|uniref:excalibur calcium-binding domain-containing protein n=1 Tax=Nocardia sp. NPDC087230 TaxID=3364331 RepID=UPI0037F14D91
MQPADPWARPPRPQDKKRRWPWVAGIGVAGVVGLAAIGGLVDDGSDPAAVPSTTSTIRPSASSTTISSTTTSPSTTTVAPTTTVEMPVPPIVPTTTPGLPLPPVIPSTRTPTMPVPAPRVDVPEPEAPPTPSTYYKNCAAARAAGAAPLHRGEPGYRSGLDADGDGIACDRG